MDLEITDHFLDSFPGSPLYVIDGVPTFDGRDLSSINGIDIKSISVLKDAAGKYIWCKSC